MRGELADQSATFAGDATINEPNHNRRSRALVFAVPVGAAVVTLAVALLYPPGYFGPIGAIPEIVSMFNALVATVGSAAINLYIHPGAERRVRRAIVGAVIGFAVYWAVLVVVVTITP